MRNVVTLWVRDVEVEIGLAIPQHTKADVSGAELRRGCTTERGEYMADRDERRDRDSGARPYARLTKGHILPPNGP